MDIKKYLMKPLLVLGIVACLTLTLGCTDTGETQTEGINIVETQPKESSTVTDIPEENDTSNFSTIETETSQMLEYYRNDFPYGRAGFDISGNISTSEYTKSEWEHFKQADDENLKSYVSNLLESRETEFSLNNAEFDILRHDIGLFENEIIVQYTITVYNDEGYVEIEGEINYKRLSPTS